MIRLMPKAFIEFTFAVALLATPVATAGVTDPIDPKIDIPFKTIDRKEIKMSDIFKKEFILVDFSRQGCPACKEEAERVNGSDEIQKLFTEGRCDYLVITPKEGLAKWVNWIGADTFVSKHSFAPTKEYDEVAQETFGFDLNAVPTLILVDRSGKNLGEVMDSGSETVRETCTKK